MAQPIFDVIVVGSGASGGWACKRLSEAGLKVALVDAGRQQKDSNFSEHKPAYELKYHDHAPEVIRRTRPVQKDCYACMEWNYDWFANDLDEPYTTAPGKPYSWQGRLRVTGGRTNVWGRVCLRLSDWDLKAASTQDGYGVDWPLSYKDLESYYGLVEEYVGITGAPEGIPWLPDGHYQPPMALTCVETQVREQVKAKLGRTVMLARCANMTKPQNGRAACHYCGPCERGCVTHSYFNSYFTTVADAIRSGNCTHIANAMVYKVLMNPETNRARGVLYIDRVTREPKEVKARAVILCAQAQESVRILLNSADKQHSNGLANSSGVLGHYLMDHVMGGGASAEFPGVPGKPTLGGPNRPADLYVARFRNVPGGPRSKNFLRGFGYEGGGGSEFRWNAPGFGQEYKEALRDGVQIFGIDGFGECLARWDNYVEVDPDVKDTFGIPVLRYHMAFGDNELAMVQDMAASAAEMLEAAGGRNVKIRSNPSTPGWAIHEVGTARMGENPKTSVLNQFQQAHDVKNLFVMDGAGFPSTACQNPTLTIMTLCTRSCDHLMQRMKRGEV